MNDFGKELTAYRERRGWSRPKMAMLTNISKSTLEGWENKRREPADYMQESLFCWFDTLGLPEDKK